MTFPRDRTSTQTAIVTHRIRIGLGCALLLASPASARPHAQDASTPPAQTGGQTGTDTAGGDAKPTAEPLATSERGLVGEVILTDAPKGLRAKPDQPVSAPILVRVSEVERPGGIAHRVEFIGSVAGDYDLRSYLELGDGSPANGIAPIPVRVVSQLPQNHGSDLYSVPGPPFRLESHYRTIFIALAAAWIAVPIIVFVRRRMRRVPPPVFVPEPPAPTIADLLRPLIEAAMSSGLSIKEQGRLELLLLHYWRDRLGLENASPSQAIAAMRAHPEAGSLLRAVEVWLHARGSGAARPAEDIGALLAPYASAAAPAELLRIAPRSQTPAEVPT
jgi:hypothetical protein